MASPETLLHSDMESSDALRCKRNDGARWRCKELASPGKSYCERHLIQLMKSSLNRVRNSGERGCCSSSSRVKEEAGRRKEVRVFGCGSRGEESEDQLKRNGSLVRKEKRKLSNCDRENNRGKDVTSVRDSGKSEFMASKLSDGKDRADSAERQRKSAKRKRNHVVANGKSADTVNSKLKINISFFFERHPPQLVLMNVLSLVWKLEVRYCSIQFCDENYMLLTVW